jgi:5'-nucleotidase
MERPLILITNDDGIASPGLAAVVAALDPLGDLLIAAPLIQQTSMGRSRTHMSDQDGQIVAQKVWFGEKSWDGFAVRATPALVVEHALQELAPRRVTLAVSGINYGENIGSCITASGTIGAALEAAERGIPALAISLETEIGQYFEHDESVDFSTAMYFTHFFAARMLGKLFPADVDVLKIEIPKIATPASPWVVTRQDRLSYYAPKIIRALDTLNSATVVETMVAKGQFSVPGTDAHALMQGFISVTPLSLDCTSRFDLGELQKLVELEN